jgi:hypothetical protein
MKEWTRTILLVTLLLAGILFIIWAHHTADANLLQGINR